VAVATPVKVTRAKSIPARAHGSVNRLTRNSAKGAGRTPPAQQRIHFETKLTRYTSIVFRFEHELHERREKVSDVHFFLYSHRIVR
jgi:hypothetical protein